MNSVPLKRTRAKRSCDFCRKRKSRCDADISTPCTNCRAWGYTCEFETVRKKRGPPSVYVDNLEKKCRKMESLLMTLTKCSIKDLESNDFKYNGDVHSSDEEDLDGFDPVQLDDITKDYDSIKYTGESSIGTKLLDSNIFKDQSSIPWPGRDNIILKLMSQDELVIVRTEKSSTTGRSDTLLDVGLSMKAPLLDDHYHAVSSIPPAKNTSKNPLKHQLDAVIDIYFSHLHGIFPIVNKPKFLDQYHNSAISSPPSILLQAVLALAFRFASVHLPKLINDAQEFGDMYFRKVMKRLRDVARSRLCHVQAALLMSLYLDMDEADVESIQWCTLGSAIRMAQDLGLQRSCTNWNIPRSEIETRHRVFYGCYVMDRWLGARAGKPLTILDRDFDTDMPSPYEVFDSVLSSNPPTYRSFIMLIKLSEILGRVLKALYAPNAKKSNTNAGLDDPTILVVFEKRLQQWKTSLDEPFEGTVFTDLQRQNLELYLYTVMLLVHRPFNQLSAEEYPQLQSIVADSEKACSYAANKISKIVQEREKHLSEPHYYQPLFFPSCYVYSLFQSSLVYLSNSLRNRSQQNIQLLYRSIRLLENYKAIEPAPRSIEILNMLTSINGLDIRTNKDREENVLSPNPTTSTPPALSQAITDTSPVEHYAKSQFFQHRYINTSIVGGITSDIQSDVGIVMARENNHAYYRQHQPRYNDPYLNYNHQQPYDYPYTTLPPLLPVNASVSYTPLPQVPQAYTAAYDPNMNVTNTTLPPSSLNWSDWDVYLGHQHTTQ